MTTVIHMVTQLILIALFISASASAESLTSVLRFDPQKDLIRGAQIEVSSATGGPGTKYSFESLADHDLSTNWATANSAPPPQWIQATFAEPETVDTVVLVTRGASTIYSDWKRIRIEFESGDPVTADLDERAGAHIVRFAARTSRWLRIVVTEDWGRKVYYGLYALLAFHDPEGQVRREIAPEELWRQISLVETGRDAHPCVYLTPADVERAKHNIEAHEWAREHAEGIIRAADTVVGKSAAWIRQNCPDRGAAFAYGFTGCPICSAKWGTWGGADCSFDRPGTVRCRNGHVLPNAVYPDPGTGYLGDDGRIHYVVGSYNA
ncbi:MAG: discoidin domain-containing protein, partial [Candidatus Brocadiia bacterium]|nr:discoidin domain-containing protein [Candidatus Brocadiia bacterium]